MELLARKDYIRILASIQRSPKSFSKLQKELNLNPAQVDRALKFLRKEFLVVPRVEPSSKGRLLVEYEMGKRGRAFLESFKVFSHDAMRRKSALGESVAAELESFTR